MGSSTAFALARRGQRVVALDPYPPGHQHGSSHGESRAIRLGYFEHPSYVPLARAAYDAWRELEALTGESILTVTGVLEAGRPGSQIVAGSIEASRIHGLPHEVLTGSEVNARYPQFSLPGDWQAVFQPDGGFLRPELAIRLYARLAEAAGATLRVGIRALGITPRAGAVTVDTDHGPIEAGAVVVAAGGWIGGLIPEIRPKLTLTRQVLAWFEPSDPASFSPSAFPVFILDSADDVVYGFPDFAGTGVKVASHQSSGVLDDADAARQDAGQADVTRLRASLGAFLPGANGNLLQNRTCFYTRTPDEDFVLDVHPGDPRIVIASPCSGHGFKFTSVIGGVLADLATNRRTRFDIDRFRLSRLDAN